MRAGLNSFQIHIHINGKRLNSCSSVRTYSQHHPSRTAWAHLSQCLPCPPASLTCAHQSMTPAETVCAAKTTGKKTAWKFLNFPWQLLLLRVLHVARHEERHQGGQQESTGGGAVAAGEEHIKKENQGGPHGHKHCQTGTDAARTNKYAQIIFSTNLVNWGHYPQALWPQQTQSRAGPGAVTGLQAPRGCSLRVSG